VTTRCDLEAGPDLQKIGLYRPSKEGKSGYLVSTHSVSEHTLMVVGPARENRSIQMRVGGTPLNVEVEESLEDGASNSPTLLTVAPKGVNYRGQDHSERERGIRVGLLADCHEKFAC